MTRPRLLVVALVASAVLHTALLLLPGLRLRLPIYRETLVEVQVVTPTEVPPPKPVPTPSAAPPTPPAAMAPTRLADAAAMLLEQALAPAMAPPAVAPPPLQLPRRELELPGAATITWTPPPPQAAAQPPQDSVFRPPTALPAGPDQQQARHVADTLLRDLAVPREEPVGPLVAPPLLEIEGPVGQERKVVNRPPPPQVAIRHSADVHLKFFVSPRGEVLRAEPLTRGDAALDQAARSYILQFRFSPLPAGDQREQWGTIHVRFRLE